MHFRSSSKFALALSAALTLGAAAEASAQAIPRGGKEPPPPTRTDTVWRPGRVDTVTVFRRPDTVMVTRYDTVRMEPAPMPMAMRTYGRGMYFGLGGGLTSPNREFRNYEPGWNATAMVGVDPVSFPLGWRVDVSYDQFAERTNLAELGPDPSLFSVNGDLKLRIPIFPTLNRVAIYGLGGLSYVRYKDMIVGPRVADNVRITTAAGATAARLDLSSQQQATDKWGWNGGAGLSFGLGNSADLFIESRFIAATWDTDQSYVPIVAGFTWSFGGMRGMRGM